MLRTLIIFIFFLLTFAGITLFLMQETGFATFNYGDLNIELPLVRFVIGLFIFITILYFILRILSFLFNAPKRIQESASRSKQQKAINNTKQGLTKFILGDWDQSEKLLLKGANSLDSACINYIWAARSAHHAGDYEARDHHLGMAKKCTPDAHAALNVLQAELLLDQGLPEQALASLNQQTDNIRSNPKIAMLFATAYEKLNDWEKLLKIIPELNRTKGLDKKLLRKIEKQTILGLLNSDTEKTNTDITSKIRSQFKEVIASDRELTAAYAKALCRAGKDTEAEALISKSLNDAWDSKLVYLYGLLKLDDYTSALKNAEQWAQSHTNDPNLYLTLGRLCKRAQLWGKSKAYFESSLSRKPLPEAYAELAALHEQLDEVDDAYQCTKKGLKLATKVV